MTIIEDQLSDNDKTLLAIQENFLKEKNDETTLLISEYKNALLISAQEFSLFYAHNLIEQATLYPMIFTMLCNGFIIGYTLAKKQEKNNE